MTVPSRLWPRRVTLFLPVTTGRRLESFNTGATRELQAAAERCADGVAAAVVAGEFWPPRELTGWSAEQDEFAELFHQGAAASVAWEATS